MPHIKVTIRAMHLENGAHRTRDVKVESQEKSIEAGAIKSCVMALKELGVQTKEMGQSAVFTLPGQEKEPEIEKVREVKKVPWGKTASVVEEELRKAEQKIADLEREIKDLKLKEQMVQQRSERLEGIAKMWGLRFTAP